jgi:hypothetical protein
LPSGSIRGGRAEFVFQPRRALAHQVHERLVRGDARQQRQELLGCNELLVQPERLDLGQRIVDAQLVVMNGMIELQKRQLEEAICSNRARSACASWFNE